MKIVNFPASALLGGGTSTAAAKNQLEQLTTMREALFSQDGWGCQHVNQETNWDVPGSPEPMNPGNIVKSDPSQAVAAGGGPMPPPWSNYLNKTDSIGVLLTARLNFIHSRTEY